jgi:hypothetical protein
MKHPHQSGRSGAAVIARNLDASRIFELKSELKITRIEEFKIGLPYRSLYGVACVWREYVRQSIFRIQI